MYNSICCQLVNFYLQNNYKNKMKQTAVEWLETKVNGMIENGGDADLLAVIEHIKQAKEMEQDQHNETWDVAHQAGRFEGKGVAEENWQTFETYWKENFKQK